MRVFVTGATGFIGSLIVQDLIAAGHQVLGLVRSEEKAATLQAAGGEAHYGSLYEPDTLKSGAAQADGVIHTAFDHDFSKFVENCETDRRVIAALGSALVGSDRPLIVTSGTGMANTVPGQPAREDGPTVTSAQIPRAASEEAANEIAKGGVNVSIMRLPQVHDTAKQGLISPAIELALAKGTFAYVGDGLNRWPAAHVRDVAPLYRLALEKAQRGAIYHAVGEEGVALRDIAEVIGQRLGMPTVSLDPQDAEAHFGWLSVFAAHDMPASSALTRERLGWAPNGPTLLEDLARLDVGKA